MKKKIEIEPRLREFLKRRRVLGKFERNCRTENVGYLVLNLGGGFEFKPTPEGRDFWNNLWTEFDKELENDKN